MIIKKIRIKNYRQFKKSIINLEENISVLAGPNNCGKTSLVELLENIFTNSTSTIDESDIPIDNLKRLEDDFDHNVKRIIENHLNQSNSLLFNKIIKSLEKELQEYLIEVDIEVSYNKGEDIRKFADYLMDLTLDETSFYFKYQLNLNRNKFKKFLRNNYDLLITDNEKIDLDIFFNAYINSLEDSYFYTDKNYSLKEKIEKTKFQNLFNFKHLNASRNLDDEKQDKNFALSKSMIEFISEDKEENIFGSLPDKIREPIEEAKIKEKIKKESLDYLNKNISDISETTGGRTDQIIIDLDIELKAIKSLLSDITKAKYKVGDGLHLNESAQGLGYSNLIFIHLELARFKREKDDTIINLFIIEEPEAHMHPQMQRVFIKYLLKTYKEESVQGIVTSHSSDLVKEVKLKKLRVIREKKRFDNEIFDMNIFLNEVVSDPELERFYSLLFNINFSNIIFADKIIFYEGDTERMFIETILTLDKFKDLKNQYIAYIQVGGDYAHKYKKIIEYLQIKSLIITDIDYNKRLFKKDNILKGEVGNSAIKDFYNDDNPSMSETITVDDVYTWKDKREDELINIVFQNKEDFYTRTFEEALLCKFYNLKLKDKFSKEEWTQKRKNNNLKFSIPREPKEINIRHIVDSTSNSKTNFIYSVIINNLYREMLPNYIEGGLNWLLQ